MCVRACNALALKLDYLSTTVCQKVHFLPSDAILRILTRASCACPRTLRVSAHISREDTQDGVSVGGFKMAAVLPVQLYIGQWLIRNNATERASCFVIKRQNNRGISRDVTSSRAYPRACLVICLSAILVGKTFPGSVGFSADCL